MLIYSNMCLFRNTNIENWLIVCLVNMEGNQHKKIMEKQFNLEEIVDGGKIGDHVGDFQGKFSYFRISLKCSMKVQTE
jgi:hypothetical protein